MLSIRVATPDDAIYVGERLREADARECAMFGVDGVRAIEAGIGASVIADCLLIDGEPAAVLGLQIPDLIGGIGQPWILTGEAIERYRIGYARFARAMVARAFSMVHRLENVVDPRYTRAINLLEWLGFTVEPERDGIRYFWMEKN
jgi:hypothetical protein